jgi:two-component system chemotaxis response regulator CheY
MSSATQAPNVSSASPLPVPGLATEATTKKYKIMVVDDENDARELFVELIQADPLYEVTSAVDGVDALAKAETQNYDLFLLDIVMPRKDGVQTLSEIKTNPDKYGTPKVIMLTNIGGDIAVEEAMKLGADGYKLKIDTEPEDLLKTIQEILGLAKPAAGEGETAKPSLTATI